MTPRPCSIESQKVSEKKMNTQACCRELIRVEDQVAEVFWFSIGWLMVAEGVRRAIYGEKKEQGSQSVAPRPPSPAVNAIMSAVLGESTCAHMGWNHVLVQ